MRRQRSRSTVAVVNNGMHVGGHNGMASRWPGRAGARRTRPLPTAAFNSENYMSSRGAANIAYRLFNQGAVRASVRSSSVVLRRLLSAPPAAVAAAAGGAGSITEEMMAGSHWSRRRRPFISAADEIAVSLGAVFVCWQRRWQRCPRAYTQDIAKDGLTRSNGIQD